MLYVAARVITNALAVAITVAIMPGIFLNPYVAVENPYLNFLAGAGIFIVLGALFWGIHVLVWPVILFFTGRIIIWSFGLFLIVLNTFVFYLLQSELFVATFTPDYDLLVIDEPAWLWMVFGGCGITLILTLLEGAIGLDSPIVGRPQHSRLYWRVIGRISAGGRNVLAENLRIAQLLDTIVPYLKDIAFDGTPLIVTRQFALRFLHRGRKVAVGETAPETLRLMLEDLGPTFVKLGQIVSTRAEHLPPAYRDSLAKLQSSVDPFPYEEVERIIKAELKGAPEELFASFERTPIAAGSTAQVHKATLKDGTVVVVKVQRPDIDVTVRADLNVLRDLTHVLERRFEWARDSDLSGIMDEYAKNVAIELDYTTEALNCRYLAANMEDFAEVHIPAIFGELSTARVLTQEFVEGVEVSKSDALDAAGVDRSALARGLVRAMIKQVLFDGFFHGDPHPGNVLVDTKASRLIFLDLGMVGTLTKDKRLALADLIWSLQEGDARAVGRVALSLTKRFKEVDEARFIQDIELVLKRWFALSFEGVSLSTCVKALFGAIYAHGLRLDPDMTLALKALLLTESSVAGLDPKLRLLPTAFEESKNLLVAQFDPDKIEQALKRELIRGAKEVVRHIPDIQDAVVVWLDHIRRGRFTPAGRRQRGQQANSGAGHHADQQHEAPASGHAADWTLDRLRHRQHGRRAGAARPFDDRLLHLHRLLDRHRRDRGRHDLALAQRRAALGRQTSPDRRSVDPAANATVEVVAPVAAHPGAPIGAKDPGRHPDPGIDEERHRAGALGQSTAQQANAVLEGVAGECR